MKLAGRKVAFSFTMTPDVAQRLKAAADRQRRSMAFMICEAVEFYLRHLEVSGHEHETE